MIHAQVDDLANLGLLVEVDQRAKSSVEPNGETVKATKSTGFELITHALLLAFVLLTISLVTAHAAQASPVADFYWDPDPALAIQDLNFHGDDSYDTDNNNWIETYEWDFDGNGVFDEFSYDESATTMFDAGGIHHVGLRVTNDIDETSTVYHDVAVLGFNERMVINWDNGSDVDIHAWDDLGNHAYYNRLEDIPDTRLIRDIIPGYGPERFGEYADLGRRYTFGLCQYSGTDARVAAMVTDPGGVVRGFDKYLANEKDAILVTTSPEGGSYIPDPGWCGDYDPTSIGGGDYQSPPPPLPPGTCSMRTAKAGPLVATASCFKKKGSVYTATGAVRINGIDLSPVGSARVSIDTKAMRISSSGKVAVKVGDISLFSDRINWNARATLNLRAGVSAKIKGLPLSGDVTLKFSNGKTSLTANARIGGSGAGGPDLTGRIAFAADNGTGLKLDSMHLAVGELPVKQLRVVSGLIDYRAAQDEWSGSASAKLPGAAAVTVKGTLVLRSGRIASAGIGVSGINKPIGTVVYLQEVGLTVGFSPISVTGTGQFTAGPKVLGVAAAQLDASINADFGSPISFGLTGKFKLAQVPLSSGSARFTVPGSLTISGTAGWKFAHFGIEGEVSGDVDRNWFLVEGSTKVIIPANSVSGRTLVSKVGIAGCGTKEIFKWPVTLGFGMKWGKRPSLMGSCGFSAFRLRSSGFSRLFVNVATAPVNVPSHVKSAVIRVSGPAGSAPAAILRAPDGSQIDTSLPEGASANYGWVVIPDADSGSAEVSLSGKIAGNWSVDPATTSSVTALDVAPMLPNPKVSVKVKKSGRRYWLSWRSSALSGQRLQFVEISATGSRLLKTTPSRSGSKAFTPHVGPSKRKLQVTVLQDGLPRSASVAARFRVPAHRPHAPKLRIKRSGTKMTIRWSRTAGAVSYSLRVSVTDGRRLAFTRKASNKRKIVIRGVKKNRSLRASIRAVSPVGTSKKRKAHAK